MAEFREARLVSVIDIANAIRFAKGRDDPLGKVIFLIGAGCSVTAGIPGAARIARRMARDLGKRFGHCDDALPDAECYARLVAARLTDAALTGDPKAAPTDDTIDWYRIYDDMFRRHYTAPDDVRTLFADLVTEAGGAINWAHLCLGEMVQRKLVSTVLTTNFDQLVLSGMARAGILPVVCDGIESLNRIAGAPRHPQLVELHGSRHTYLLRNRPEDVEAVRNDPQALAAIQKLFQHATTFVAIGYGGREAGVMDLLIGAGQAYPDKNLFWVSHSNDPKLLDDKVRSFLATSRNAGLLIGQDADRFFLELCQALGVGAPGALGRPLEALERVVTEIARSAVTDPDIRAEIDTARNRLATLQASATAVQRDSGVADIVARIREAKLAGKLAEAYRLAEEAIG